MQKNRGEWSNHLGFILAAAGSAVGLGNIWKFPGKLGANGGGLFLLIYIVVVAVIGLSIMLAELAIGRATQKNAVGAFRKLNKKWMFAVVIGMITLFVILSYYSIVGGWIMKYIAVYFGGAHFSGAATQYQDFFTGFITDPIEPILWGLLFLGLCIFIILKGVAEGIEKISKVLMPALFLLLIATAIRSVTLPGAMEGVRFMLHIDFSAFHTDMLVAAVGQAFFSLSVGMGILITYGSYVGKKENLMKSAVWICVLDTLVAILAAFAIIPAVFVTMGAEGLGMGGGFAFMALPNVFASIPGGVIFGAVFFILLFLAALTSAISILESIIACMSEEFHITRRKAVVWLFLPLMILAAGYSLSQLESRGLNLPWFDMRNGLQLLSMNAVMEKFTDNLMIPLGALCFCIFTGWVWGVHEATDEFENEGTLRFRWKKLWSLAIRYLAPAAILIILYFTICEGMILS